jgi:hypothetical protein
MPLGPQPYPVVYDTQNGLSYVLPTVGIVGIATDNNAITALTGDVTATGPGSAAATISAATVTGKLITGYVSGAGTVAVTDTILQAINKLNGNTAAATLNTISRVATDPISPTEGTVWYNTTSHVLKYYDGTTVQTVAHT